MSYLALLFCPDERTARTVTQVLTELDFQVQQCNEPFAAVKKLTAEHFDALVVDCDNEQNATLLFKSARNSGSNQASLSIAVVEGQAGVAKAFRIGANLVLTKPINVEQSKGTVRVARGLLRKSDSAKATTPSAPAAAADLKRPVTAEAPSSVLELEKDPEPKPDSAEAAFLESIESSHASKPAAGMTESPSPNQNPWQPIPKPMAEPMAAALQHAAEATRPADSYEVSDAAELASPSHISAQPSGVSSTVFGSGAAAAPAPAKKQDSPAIEESDTQEVELPPFLTAPSRSRPEHSFHSADNWKTGLIAALVLIAAAVGYAEWKGKIHLRGLLSSVHKPVPQATVPQSQVPVAPPSTPAVKSEPVTTGTGTSAQLEKPAQPVTELSTTSVNTNSLPEAPEKGAVSSEMTPPTPKKAPATIASTSVAPPSAVKTVSDETAPDALVVKGGSTKPVVQAPAQPEEPEATAPGALNVASDSNDQTIAGLVNTPASVPHPSAETLRVSQGVSQGLLVKKVAPIYPPQAIQRHIEGTVEIAATISKDGDITDLKLLSGDVTLARAAMDAVKQWKYKAYYLDGQPVDIQTQITVNFKLP